jgi:hypothetical protein
MVRPEMVRIDGHTVTESTTKIGKLTRIAKSLARVFVVVVIFAGIVLGCRDTVRSSFATSVPG